MISINKVLLQGYVGNDPEVRKTSQGKEMINFSVGTNDNKQKDSPALWHRVIIFKDSLLSPVKLYVKKGTRVFVEGKLKSRKYTDKNGKDNVVTEIIVSNSSDSIQFENKNQDIVDHNQISDQDNLEEISF